GEYQRGIEAEFSEQFQLALETRQVLRAQVRTQQREGVAVEGDRNRAGAGFLGISLEPLHDSAVTGVHTIELADGDGRAAEICRHLCRVAEDDHAVTSAGRCVRSHQMPNTGSIKGMNT